MYSAHFFYFADSQGCGKIRDLLVMFSTGLSLASNYSSLDTIREKQSDSSGC